MIKSSKIKDLSHATVRNWDAAIAEAEDQIRRSKRRIGMLEGAIQVFRARRDAGEAWPGDESATRS